MVFRIALRTKADKAVARLAASTQQRLRAGFAALQEDPFRSRPGADIKVLQGNLGQHRLRVGEYRVFYVVDGDIVFVTDVLHRSHAYD